MQHSTKRKVILAGSLFILLLVTLPLLFLVRQEQVSSSRADTVLQCASAGVPDIPTATSSASSTEVSTETNKLEQANGKGLAALFSNPQQVRQNIRDIAQTRKLQLLSLMQRNPKQAYNEILPQNDRQTIALQTQNCVEQTASVSGTLEMHIVDYQNQPDRTLYFIRTSDNKTVRFYPTQNLPDGVTTGSRISAIGYLLDNSLLVNTGNSADFAASTAPNGTIGTIGKIDSLGDQKLMIVIANFQDTQSPSLTSSQVTSTVFTDVNNFYKDVSFGKTSWSGTVYNGVVSLPMATTCTDLTGIENNVIKILDPTVDFNTYHRLLVFAPYGPDCPWKGESTVGEGIANTAEGSVPLSISLVNTDSDTLQIVGHELGHSLGLGHSGTLVCSPFGSTSCTLDEYADPYSIMGNIGLGMNAFDKETMGWFDTGNVQTVTTSGTYSISPLETEVNGPMVLKIPTPDNNYLYVEYRQPIGVDKTYLNLDPNTNVYTGALLHIQEPLNKSALLLISPNIVGLKHALQANQSYTYSGIKVTVTGVTSTALTAQLTIPGSTQTTSTPTPSVTTTITPTLSAAPTQTAGGGSLSFAVSLALGGIDGSNTPLHPTRTLTLAFYNSAGQEVTTMQGDVTYESSNTIFDGVIPGNSSLTPGLYMVKAEMQGYLNKFYPVPIQFSSNSQFTLPQMSLTGGDVNGDNKLNIIDYQEIIDCFAPAAGAGGTCTQDQRQRADLNDDGKVDQVDYNIFLRQLTVHHGD